VKINFINRINILGLCFLQGMAWIPAFSQQNLNNIKLMIGSKAPLEVELVAQMNSDNHRPEYYYLPNNLRVSTNQQAQPELLFMAWNIGHNTQETQGILHWILTWGLDADQEAEVEHLLKSQVDSTAVLMGSILVQPIIQDFKIAGTNDTMIQLLIKNMTSGGTIPTSSGGKSAAAFKFSGPDALAVLAAYRDTNKWKQAFIEMPFSFSVPGKGLKSKTLKLEVKTIFQQLLGCKECIKLI